MICTSKGKTTVTNSMGVNHTVFTSEEYARLTELMLNLTCEELLDLQHMIKYPSRKTTIMATPNPKEVK